MVNLDQLTSEQNEAIALAKQLQYVGTPLDQDELDSFGRAFERQLVIRGVDRDMSDLLNGHRTEILIGAMVAKQQMSSVIGGEQPDSGGIAGPVPLRAYYLGVGQDWEDTQGVYNATQNTWTTGTLQNWIHSGTQILGGTNGNAVKVLENAVHVILGIGTYSPQPKMESAQFTINGKLKDIFNVFQPTKIMSSQQMKIREFDGAIILQKNSTFLAQVFYSKAFGGLVTNVSDYPFLYGVSFIKEDVQRTPTPGIGVNTGLITTT